MKPDKEIQYFLDRLKSLPKEAASVHIGYNSNTTGSYILTERVFDQSAIIILDKVDHMAIVDFLDAVAADWTRPGSHGSFIVDFVTEKIYFDHHRAIIQNEVYELCFPGTEENEDDDPPF